RLDGGLELVQPNPSQAVIGVARLVHHLGVSRRSVSRLGWSLGLGRRSHRQDEQQGQAKSVPVRFHGYSVSFSGGRPSMTVICYKMKEKSCWRGLLRFDS